MEINGLVSLKCKVEQASANNEMTTGVAIKLLSEIEILDRYLTAYNYCKVLWHEVKAKPGDFPTNGEMQRRLFKASKEIDTKIDKNLKEEQRAFISVSNAIQQAYPGRKLR